MLTGFVDPFDLQTANYSAQHFRELVMPHLPGADEKEKFAPIFASAPLWLVWFTFANGTMEVLGLPPRDLSEIRRFRRPEECFRNWPALPPGIFENIPWSDSELAERHQISQKAHEIWKLHEDDISLGPRCGSLEFKYRFPEKFVK